MTSTCTFTTTSTCTTTTTRFFIPETGVFPVSYEAGRLVKTTQQIAHTGAGEFALPGFFILQE